MSSSTNIPEDLYQNIKLNQTDIVETYIKTLEYNNKTIDLLSNFFMYAVDQRSYDTAKLLACYGANTHGWGDWAKYYTMRRRVVGIDSVINRPLEVCETCNKTTICNCGCNQ